MTYRRCQSCRTFYDKKAGACTECGAQPSGLNKWLVTAKLNNHLYDQARSAASERA